MIETTDDRAPLGCFVVVLPPARASEEITYETRLLGLTLLARVVEGALRAGAARVFVAGEVDPAKVRFIGAEPLVACTAAKIGPREAAHRVVTVAANVLVRPAWFERVINDPLPTGAAVEPDAFSAADLHNVGRFMETVAREPTQAAAEAAINEQVTGDHPVGRDNLHRVWRTADERRGVERWMLAGLVKETEGFMSRRVERPISLAITRRLVDTGLSPNAMTLVSVAVGLAAAPCFLVGGGQWQIVGAILFLAHSILDGCDGELARLRHQQSRLGGIMDFWGDNVVHAAIFFCMGLGWARFEGSVWPLAAGVVAATATFGAAGFIYWTTMRDRTESGPLFTSITRGPESALSRLLDALSRRDFIYLVLVLALFGRAHWFVAVAAVGTPLYLVLLIAVSIIALRPAR